MSIKKVSAQMNVVAPMIQMGLLDESGAPSALANEWRNDATYSAACEKIREKIYPRELLDLAPDTSVDKATVQQWIASHAMVGREAARQSASVYMLLLEADASKGGDGAKAAAAKGSATSSARKVTKPPAKKKEHEEDKGKNPPAPRLDPNLNINIQIHISADTSAEQVEKIFSSMAKHLGPISKA
jgi:hypothetical protein